MKKLENEWNHAQHIINRPIWNASLNNDKRKLAMYSANEVKDIKVELITVIDEVVDMKRNGTT